MMFRAGTWIVSIIVGVFSIVVLTGVMSSPAPPPQPALRGFGPEDVEEKVPAGTAFELPTFNRFLSSASSGIMPGNNRTELPVFPDEYMKYFLLKYEEWAPAPFDKIPGPQGSFGATTLVSPAPIIRAMHVMSGLDDIFAMAFTQTMPKELERSFKVTKARIWHGLAPVSDARWRSQGFDKEEKHEEALAVIQQVIDIWRYLATPEIQGELRQTFNKLWAEIDTFQDACNALQKNKGLASPGHSLTALWQEYMSKHLSYMEHQSRSWAFKHLKELHIFWKDRFQEVFLSGRQLNATQATVKIDHYSMMILNKIQDMYLDADWWIRARETGFIMPHGVEARMAHPVNDDAPKAQLDALYAQIENENLTNMREAMRDAIAQRTRERIAFMGPTPGFMDAPQLLFDREWTHKTAQPQVENPLPGKEEPWVTTLALEKVEEFGFVIYRLCYGDEMEWETFVRKMEDGLSSGWQGVVGSDKIKSKSRLHWIDGREEKIAEGDIGAAREDFKTILTLPAFPSNLQKGIFLAITPTSFKSFADTCSGDRKGDYRGFLHAVDANFDAEDVNKKAYPKGYDGNFKIIDQLVWTDLLAMNVIAPGSTSAQDCWALATQHPWGVYVGPTTGVKRRHWREMRTLLGYAFQGMEKK